MELIYPGKISEHDLFRRTEVAHSVDERPHEFSGWADRLYHGDNLPVLRTLCDEGAIHGHVKLVYIDPPYASQREFKHRKELDALAYEDTLDGCGYVEFIRRRLIFLRHLLAEDGSIYVHLDGNMIFHIKIIMDEIFGAKNYRNLIVRKKCHSKNYTRKQYGNVADYILFYSKSSAMRWNRPYEESNIYSVEQRFPRVEAGSGRRFALVPVHAPGTRNGETGKPWRGQLPPPGKHWQVPPSELDRLDEAGEIHWSASGNPRRKFYADRNQGVPVQDIWLKYMDYRNQNMNETGYPTEKNTDLLRRIIAASSDPGDLVLDCFCGSGTTLAAAREAGRRWVGVDSGDLAIQTAIDRLQAGGGEVGGLDQGMLFDRPEASRPNYRLLRVIERGATPASGAAGRSSMSRP